MNDSILITGGAGFIGHHVIGYLLKNTDYDIVTLDRLDSSGNLNRLAEVLDQDKSYVKRVKILFHDLKAPINDFLIQEIGNVTSIVHLAAGTHVDRSITNPLEFVYDNVVGTANLLEYARLFLRDTLKKFIYFSTDEVFGPAPFGVFYKENDRYNSSNPYSATKAGGEELCVSYENTYNMPIIITHTMNAFGIRQHKEKYLPLVINAVNSGSKIFIHADKSKTQAGMRHYINTEDIASAMLFLLKNSNQGEKYNIVGAQETSNLELAQIVASILDKPLVYELVDCVTSRPGHDFRYALDGNKMKNLGWVPERNLTDRLKEVIDWSLKNRRWLGV